MSKPVYIGIDPAFRKDGFCVCIIDEVGDVDFITFKDGFLGFILWLWKAPDNVIVTIENSNLQNTTFVPKGANVATKMRRSRDAGKNMAASQYTVDTCRAKFGDHRTIEISPRAKGPKWSDKTFLLTVKQEGHKLLSYRGKQDERDAYKLALLGRKFIKFKRKAS